MTNQIDAVKISPAYQWAKYQDVLSVLIARHGESKTRCIFDAAQEKIGHNIYVDPVCDEMLAISKRLLNVREC